MTWAITYLHRPTSNKRYASVMPVDDFAEAYKLAVLHLEEDEVILGINKEDV